MIAVRQSPSRSPLRLLSTALGAALVSLVAGLPALSQEKLSQEKLSQENLSQENLAQENREENQTRDEGSHRIEIRKIARVCEGEDCEEDRRVVIQLDDQRLSLPSIPGLANLELLRDDGSNVFVFGGGAGGYLGVQLIGLTEALRSHFGVPEGQGVLVSEVSEDTPAWRAGLEAGDVITAVGSEEVSSSSALARMIRSTEPGASVDLEVWREGQPITITAQIDERASPAGARAFFLDCEDDEDGCNHVTLRGLDFGCDGGDCEVEVSCEDGECTCTVDGEDNDCESLERFQWNGDRRFHFRQQQ